MDIYKEFMYRLRNYNLQDVYLILHEDLSPKLKEYISLLRDVPFEDGSYHTYYAGIKKVVSTFLNYFIQTIDEVTLEVDKYTNVLCKDDLINLMEKTISIHEKNQIDFAKEFSPITAPIEEQIYEEIESRYDVFKSKLKDFQSQLEQLNKKEQIEAFAKSNHFQYSLKKSSDLFHFVHIFIGMMLADRLYQIRVSLEEILLRVRNNLQLMRDEEEEVLSSLRNELYDKNKEQLFLNRSYKRNSMEEAEVKKGIEIMQEKIENRETNVHISCLEQEVSSWEKRVAEFRQCADLLTKLKTEFDTIVKEENVYNNLRINEKPGPKFDCWKNIGNNYKERKQYLNVKIADAAKALLTFFSCRGADRIYYKDNVGPYYIDEYNHKVYYFNHGLDIYHTDCDGKFIEIPRQAYYYDSSGRYTIENGNKFYQCAPCTSKYILDENELLKKITQDCGHSEKANEKCRLDFKDTVEAPLAYYENAVNIKLPPEAAEYLWTSFGGILPEALHAVATERPKNPIHFLAHKLLQYKYTDTLEGQHRKTEQAKTYREDIYKKRKERATQASTAWKSKQVRRRKPEESDDSQNLAILDAHIARNDFINSLNYYF